MRGIIGVFLGIFLVVFVVSGFFTLFGAMLSLTFGLFGAVISILWKIVFNPVILLLVIVLLVYRLNKKSLS